jgi:lipid II:glycine glycyltransferase (peptidoglycan interpeptide bridge formation enzyme)
MNAARGLAEQRGIRQVEIKHTSPAAPLAPGFHRSTKYSTYRVPTEGGEDAVWKRLHASSTQRSIKKGKKSGIEIVEGSRESDWLAMAELEESTAHRHGLPAPPRHFFLECCESLRKQGLASLYLARIPSGEIAAGIIVWTGPREWIYAFGASRPEHLELRPNHVLIWEAMRRATHAGVTFDLGRAAPEQEGLVEFKTRWGGEAVPLAYDYWPEASGLNTAKRDSGALGLAGRVWSRLPEALARRGSFLYRYLG